MLITHWCRGGYKNTIIFNLQKKSIRIITVSTSLAHTDPLCKKNNLLKLQDIFKLQQLKFYHNYVNNKLFVLLYPTATVTIR